MFWKKKDDKFETTAGKEESQKDFSGEKAKAEEPVKDDADTVISKRDEMALLYEATIKDIKEGQIVKGRIIEIRNKDVVVDIGYKSEGIISMSEFSDRSKLKIGDEIEVYLDSKEDEHGCVGISKQKADKLQGWERIISTSKEGDVITGRPTRKVKGGLMVDIGMEAFLP
ncbi:MAG: S1 RNA-binding domain-containing protein, partial [Candidatus Omnitrophota bacterium]